MPMEEEDFEGLKELPLGKKQVKLKKEEFWYEDDSEQWSNYGQQNALFGVIVNHGNMDEIAFKVAQALEQAFRSKVVQQWLDQTPHKWDNYITIGLVSNEVTIIQETSHELCKNCGEGCHPLYEGEQSRELILGKVVYELQVKLEL